ncbi:MAG: AbrB family transcriptional regulator [Clostridiales bacterium]|nr:AbrB family transcriptional regulator [Clostridiales bacterium]
MEKKISKEIAVRAIDELGKVILPCELRNKFDIKAEDKLQIFEREDEIVIKKYKPSCTFCGAEKALIMFNEKYVCKECIRSIHSLTESEQ